MSITHHSLYEEWGGCTCVLVRPQSVVERVHKTAAKTALGKGNQGMQGGKHTPFCNVWILNYMYAFLKVPNVNVFKNGFGMNCGYRVYAVVVQSLSHVWLFATPWTVAHQAPLSKGFPSKNTGVGCHFLLEGISQPRTKPVSPALQVDSLSLSHQGTPHGFYIYIVYITNVLYCLLGLGAPALKTWKKEWT